MPGQLHVAGLIDRWGASAIYARPLSVREAARFASLLNIYRRYQGFGNGLRKVAANGKSTGIALFDWLTAGEIHQYDYDLIDELIKSGTYRPKG